MSTDPLRPLSVRAAQYQHLLDTGEASARGTLDAAALRQLPLRELSLYESPWLTDAGLAQLAGPGI